jgi:hypothetical protein
MSVNGSTMQGTKDESWREMGHEWGRDEEFHLPLGELKGLPFVTI